VTIARAMPCECCGKTIYVAKSVEGKVRILELLEYTFRLDEDRAVPCVGVYVDHPSRCPGDLDR